MNETVTCRRCLIVATGHKSEICYQCRGEIKPERRVSYGYYEKESEEKDYQEVQQVNANPF